MRLTEPAERKRLCFPHRLYASMIIIIIMLSLGAGSSDSDWLIGYLF